MNTTVITQSPTLHPGTLRRSPSPIVANRRGSSNEGRERFPSFDDAVGPSLGGLHAPIDTSNESRAPEYRWPSRRGSSRLAGGRAATPYTHRPRRSLSDAFNRIRTRQGSVTENAQELAEALKAPISYKLILLCIGWYMTSALTNTSSKQILNAFPQPVTLTITQFMSVSGWCLLLAWLSSVFPSLKRAIPALRNGLRYPSWDVLQTALPLSIFQLLGHLLSSYATSKIPVSLVHTIKGLSPLFTVFAYRIFLRTRYARATYLSLIPLTLGVILACSTDFSTNFLGIAAALVAALVFVTQNIFSKKLFSEADRAGDSARSRKLDKLNLLCYCSVGALIFTTPVWLYSEGFALLQDYWKDGSLTLSGKSNALDHGRLTTEFVFNGVFHFLQNIMAFILLSLMSPVSYSVASLIKRVWVIVVAVIWFRSSTTNIQLFGIGLTCVGLYLYDRFSTEDPAERRAKNDHFRPKQALLPVTESNESSPKNGRVPGLDEMFTFPSVEAKREDSPSRATHQPVQWLPPGTKQESTWRIANDGAKS